MKPERLKQIEDLYHKALALPFDERSNFELSRNNTQKAKDLDAQATEIFTQLKITAEPLLF